MKRYPVRQRKPKFVWLKAKLEGLAIAAIFLFIVYNILGELVARRTRQHEFYLRYSTESRRLTEAFDVGCLDDNCRWWPSWSVMCKRKK